MANNLVIAYRLEGGATSEEEMGQALARLGDAVPLLPGVWYVKATLGAGAAADEVRRVMNATDVLLVVDASNNELARFGLGCAACAAVDRLWEHRADDPKPRRRPT